MLHLDHKLLFEYNDGDYVPGIFEVAKAVEKLGLPSDEYLYATVNDGHTLNMIVCWQKSLASEIERMTVMAPDDGEEAADVDMYLAGLCDGGVFDAELAVLDTYGDNTGEYISIRDYESIIDDTVDRAEQITGTGKFWLETVAGEDIPTASSLSDYYDVDDDKYMPTSYRYIRGKTTDSKGQLFIKSFGLDGKCSSWYIYGDDHKDAIINACRVVTRHANRNGENVSIRDYFDLKDYLVDHEKSVGFYWQGKPYDHNTAIS